MGNLPAREGGTHQLASECEERGSGLLTLGQTRTQETRNLLDQGLGSDESVVLASELLDQLLVLVELLQVVGGHGVDAAVLGTVDIVLVTKNADAHVGTRNRRQTDGARETLVTLGVIVLEANLTIIGEAQPSQ